MNHLDIAAKYLGQSESWGNNDSAFIQKLWKTLTPNWQWLKGQPWCGGFVGDVLKEAGLPVIKDFYRAKAWADYGMPLAAPETGCIAVLSRVGGGHVAFVYGKTAHGEVILLGGNQGNKVSLMTVNPSDVFCYRAVPNQQFEPMRIYASDFVRATNQAAVFA
jgi:uncharacterized protein (TIGR02594 family)